MCYPYFSVKPFALYLIIDAYVYFFHIKVFVDIIRLMCEESTVWTTTEKFAGLFVDFLDVALTSYLVCLIVPRRRLS